MAGKIRALINTDTLPILFTNDNKYLDLGSYNIKRGESSQTVTVEIQNLGESDLEVTGYEFIKNQNTILSQAGQIFLPDQSKTYGFAINELQKFPLTIPSGKLQSGNGFYNSIPILSIKFDGNGITDKDLHNVFEYQIIFNSNDPRNGDDPDDGSGTQNHRALSNNIPAGITFSRVVVCASPTGKLPWTPNTNIVYQKNVHGYMSTPKVEELDLWKNYALKRINNVLNGVSRITIEDFLKLNDFQNNGVFNDDFPETKRVIDRFRDPLPPYDFIWPYGDYYAFNGVRRTSDYANKYGVATTSRVDQYYRRSKFWFDPNGDVDRTLVMSNDFARKFGGKGNGQKRQRREWGFREKVLKGFPYFFPKYIQPGKDIPEFPCSRGPVIAGFVTAGSGIFGGIKSSANIQYDFIETQRTVNTPTDLPYTEPKTPTGLIFIQDETGGIGFSLGSDMRYMEHPLFHGAKFAEPNTFGDKMHIGSIGIPKADYRQFLREGDLVIIQLGVGLKYWHPVLGSEPRYWESLFGDDEFSKLSRNLKIGKEDNRSLSPGSSRGNIFAAPYVDNWGAYTDRGSNNGYELAFSDDPDDFDTVPFSDEALSNYIESIINIINLTVEGVKEGVDTGTRLGGAIGAIVGAIIGGVVGISVGFWQKGELYFRERYVLRSRSLRDVQYPYIEYYPIQEYHPWSTGVPIPIDNGMPYIMSNVFSVDTRERLSPAPLEITAAQLRGIPEDTWKWDPNLEWQIPNLHQKLFENTVREVYTDPDTGETEFIDVLKVDPNSPYLVNSQNQFQEFPGIKDEPVTPYTMDPGSKYKGQLVTIKNVRFVKPPMKEYFVAKVAPITAAKTFEDDRKKTRDEFLEWTRLGKDPRDFKIKLDNIPQLDINRALPPLIQDIKDFLEIGLPSIQFAINLAEIFTGDLGGDITANDALQPLQKLAEYIKILERKIEEIKTVGVSGFTSITQIDEFLAVKHGIDYLGYKVSVNYPQELLNLVVRSIGEFNLRGQLEILGIKFLSEALDAFGLGGLGRFTSLVYNTIESYKIPEVPEPNEYQIGSITREYEYEKVFAPSQFPASVDRKNGGYWWASPDIPLTNARSHQNDANYGDPSRDGDNEGDAVSPNQDIATTERVVFSQLISSDKDMISVPIWQEDDPAWLGGNNPSLIDREDLRDEFGNIHLYNFGYIRPRYVKDLGGEYSSSYEPFAEEWKPYRYIDGQTIVKNEFQPIDAGEKFVGNRTYYVVDEQNVIIPIRINSNSEIARYQYDVPTGPIDITGIAWQYSLGVPGLEWEREAYMMQIWPRYLSDVGLKWRRPLPDTPITPNEEGEPDVPVTPPPGPPPPKRLPDITLDIGDAGNPARLDCDTFREILNTQNRFKEIQEETASWPVDRIQGGVNIHKDPVSGRERPLPMDTQGYLDSLPNYPCKGMNPGDQQYVTAVSSAFLGVTRTFFFTVGPDGECLCTMLQPGSNDGGGSTNNRNNRGGGFTGGDVL